ncbi:hypothetical protein ACM66B_005916 [Microbotryomycetes sp. NB124-2]
MRFSRFASFALLPTLWSAASAQVNVDLGDLLGLDLDISLLTNGALINANVFADLLTQTTCQATGKTVGVQALLLPLVRVCACVDLLSLGGILTQDTPCPACPANASPVCGNAGTCACACNDGFFAGPDGTCVPTDSCPPPNVLQPLPSDPRKAECVCAPGYVSNGAGGCVLIPSARARMHRKKSVVATGPHAARAQRVARAPQPTQEVFIAKPAPVDLPAPAAAVPATPVKANSTTDKFSCPNGETACPLKSGGFECLDVTSSLTSCGGCVGEGLPGVNCLAIPGALNVECQNSQCQVASCFKGWRFMSGKCV